jgi:hypothetical protein
MEEDQAEEQSRLQRGLYEKEAGRQGEHNHPLPRPYDSGAVPEGFPSHPARQPSTVCETGVGPGEEHNRRGRVADASAAVVGDTERVGAPLLHQQCFCCQNTCLLLFVIVTVGNAGKKVMVRSLEARYDELYELC